MPKLFGRTARWAAVFCITWAVAAAGCGIKGPPVPPDRKPPAHVSDLQAVVDGEEIHMSWTVKHSATVGKSALEGFYVFRWQNPISEPACPGCPKVFERIADVGVENGTPAENERLRFSHDNPLPLGYRYSLKVIGYSRDGLKSGDSNVLSFEY